MGFFSFLKYTSIIFAAHIANSCGAPFENRWYRRGYGLEEGGKRVRFAGGARNISRLQISPVRTTEKNVNDVSNALDETRTWCTNTDMVPPSGIYCEDGGDMFLRNAG
jgi:hypothetical protein